MTQALALVRTHAPLSARILNDRGGRSTFNSTLKCDFGFVTAAETALHEGIHGYSFGEKGSRYPLLNGTDIPGLHMKKGFFQAAKLRSEFGNRHNVNPYLTSGSSATDIGTLLDEVNAYTHDLNFSLNAHPRSAESELSSAGLASLTSFLAAYLRVAKESHPETWQRLQQPDALRAVKVLWEQAEAVLARACSPKVANYRSNWGTDNNRFYRNYLCDPKKMAGVAALLGKSSVCPTSACLGRPDVQSQAKNSPPPPAPSRQRWPVIPPPAQAAPSIGGSSFMMDDATK